jgi:hypothetical protein
MDEEQEGSSGNTRVTEADFDRNLRRLAVLGSQVDEAESELKDLKAQFEELSWGLANYMLTTGCTKKVLDGIMFTQRQRVFSKVEDKEALRKWIEDNQAVDLLMTVHPSKLTGYCNECLDNGTEIPTGVNPNFIKYYVSVKG